jgi:hypothetical protein
MYFTMGSLEHRLWALLERVLQFGGALHTEWEDPEVVELDCCDRVNLVTIELRRIRGARSSLVLFDL